MLLIPSFWNSTPSCDILMLHSGGWGEVSCDFQFPKAELLLPSPVRTLGQMRLSESPLANTAPPVCICSVHVLKKSKHNNIMSSRVEGHLATTRGGINLWACGECRKMWLFLPSFPLCISFPKHVQYGISNLSSSPAKKLVHVQFSSSQFMAILVFNCSGHKHLKSFDSSLSLPTTHLEHQQIPFALPSSCFQNFPMSNHFSPHPL